MRPALLHDTMRNAAHVAPHQAAIRDGDRTISFGGLESKSARIANSLRSLGVDRGDRVAVFADKSIETVAALHAIMWSGAAYVPIDPNSPTARSEMILASAGVRTIVTDTKRAAQLPGLVDAVQGLANAVVLDPSDADLDAGGPDAGGLDAGGLELVEARDVDSASESFDGPRIVDVDLAYVLYTSGSTGVPKGVMLSHGHAVGFISWAADHFDLTSKDRLSSHAPFHFDLSVFDLYASALVGASVTLVPPKASIFPGQLTKFIEQQEITVWYSVPSVLSAMLLRGGIDTGRVPTLRQVVFAGEVFPSAYLADLMAKVPHASFTNLYGPTETNVCTFFDVDLLPTADEDIPIGRPIANVEGLVVDDDLQPVEPGMAGELLVRGRAVMSGYLGDEAKTAASLVPDPRFPLLPDRLYRTGDLVSELPSGDFKFLGRNDSQVKSRGYRIELGEIETALNASDCVSECAAAAVPDPVFTNKIKVTVVSDADESALRQFCKDRLPPYMIPDLWEFVSQLPRTSTGKIDRWALTQRSNEE